MSQPYTSANIRNTNPIVAKALGLSKPTRPEYVTIAKNVLHYINAEFLPPQDMLPPGSEFKIGKPSGMNRYHLKAWILHLLKRQELKKSGDILIVFQFKSYDELTGHLIVVDVGSPESAKTKGKKPVKRPLVSKRPSIKGKRKQAQVESDDSGEEIVIEDPSDDELDLELDEEEPEDSPAEGVVQGSSEPRPEVQEGLDGNTMLPEELSPASVSHNWESRLEFLQELSSAKPYQQLVTWLGKHQVRYRVFYKFRFV